MAESERWMPSLVARFESCRDELEASGSVDLAAFVAACETLPKVFAFLGSNVATSFIFGFAETDLTTKVAHLKALCSSSDSGLTIEAMIEADVGRGRATAGDSGSRTCHRVTNAVKFVNRFMVNLLATDSDSIRLPAHNAIMDSIAYYLEAAKKTAINMALYLLPSRSKFLKRVGETGESLARALPRIGIDPHRCTAVHPPQCAD